MANFRFLHAADLHLDSPLIGLSRKSEEYAARLDDASRKAFDNLIALAIKEDCRLVVIAGDVFDGQWRDYRTGLFFADRMRQLHQAGIRVVMIAGNHDAENRFASRLELSDNVKLFSSRKAESVVMDEIGAVIHGRSFPQRDVTENIALDYPHPVEGRFNIGILHTASTGRVGHANYAPCTVEQLENHGYQYWALGHVHAREVLSTTPHIIYPGNLQGRSVRETGPKGATLVDVEDGRVTRADPQALDVIRWTIEEIDISTILDRDALLSAVRDTVDQAYAAADGRGLAMRLRLVGQSGLHSDLTAAFQSLREDIETIVAGIASDVWMEKIELLTSPLQTTQGVDPTVGGKIRRMVEDLAADPWYAQRLEARLAVLKPKIPAAAHLDALLESLKSDAPTKARALALALIEHERG
jgi:exonuclease SbcD